MAGTPASESIIERVQAALLAISTTSDDSITVHHANRAGKRSEGQRLSAATVQRLSETKDDDGEEWIVELILRLNMDIAFDSANERSVDETVSYATHDVEQAMHAIDWQGKHVVLSRIETTPNQVLDAEDPNDVGAQMDLVFEYHVDKSNPEDYY